MNMTSQTQTLYGLLKKRPFQPFRIAITDGPAFDVTHPEMAMLTQSDILIGVGKSRHGVPLECRIFSLQQVASVEPLTAVPQITKQS
jgi:hypothetical protein